MTALILIPRGIRSNSDTHPLASFQFSEATASFQFREATLGQMGAQMQLTVNGCHDRRPGTVSYGTNQNDPREGSGLLEDWRTGSAA